MQLLTLSVVALCLVNGMMANTAPTLKKKIVDGKVELTCSLGNLNTIKAPYTFILGADVIDPTATGNADKGLTVLKDEGKLTITKAKAAQNIGDYTCKATLSASSGGLSVASSIVKVAEADKDTEDCKESSAPRVIATGLAMSLCLMAASFL